MKKYLLLAVLFSLSVTDAKSQIIYTPGTYYVIPPTSGCNGVWAMQNIPGCSIVAMNPCWSGSYVIGDTLFVNLCSLPCYYNSMTMSGGMCPAQICQYAPYTPPTAGFIASDATICAGDSIQILNTSSNAVSYQWSVPGALPALSTEVDPYFQFPVSGAYELTLVAANPGGLTDTTTSTITVKVENSAQASFVSATIISQGCLWV